MENSILEMVKEVDYQKEYDYDKRVELFNKYHISTSLSYINPIMLLTERLLNPGMSFSRFYQFDCWGTSHHGAVKTAFNQKIKEDRSDFCKIRELKSKTVITIKRYKYDSKKFELVMNYHIENDLVHFSFLEGVKFSPKRGFCFIALAEEFCKDLGYDIKFE
ncbi:gp275 [Sphingomonas phage PAU]|uniref:gp275 n=1 Tax=Sphingomonas phage PAU TaxID=1150991 RepID=UPI0002573419|nr:gp275 [Sphingomonas phage PAU]AFF28273.1 gp275 [Sphingomonas phage PAU]